MRKKATQHYIYAIILAGGSGERMGGHYKQFMHINSKPILYYSIDKFLKCTSINRIVIVVPPGKYKIAQRLIYKEYGAENIDIIKGGSSRRYSSYNALKFIEKSRKRCDYVVFHDGVRPLITVKMIESVIRQAILNRAAVLGAGILNVIVEVENGIITNALPFDRKKIQNTQTPHCYQFNLILEAHESKVNKGRQNNSLENIELFFRTGKKIKVVNQFYRNMKITYKQDVVAVEAILKKLEYASENFFELKK